jgi:hypothetical protein
VRHVVKNITVDAKKIKRIQFLAGMFLRFVGLALVVLVLIGQVFPWLKSGFWPEMTFGTVVRPVVAQSGFYTWLVAPQSWFGLHSLIRFVWDFPLWLWLVCSAVAAFVLSRE